MWQRCGRDVGRCGERCGEMAYLEEGGEERELLVGERRRNLGEEQKHTASHRRSAKGGRRWACGEIWEMGRSKRLGMWGDMGRYGEVWGGMGRSGEIWGDLGRWRTFGRSSSIRREPIASQLLMRCCSRFSMQKKMALPKTWSEASGSATVMEGYGRIWKDMEGGDGGRTQTWSKASASPKNSTMKLYSQPAVSVRREEYERKIAS